jgi:hypothetical protein
MVGSILSCHPARDHKSNPEAANGRACGYVGGRDLLSFE